MFTRPSLQQPYSDALTLTLSELVSESELVQRIDFNASLENLNMCGWPPMRLLVVEDNAQLARFFSFTVLGA
jgi:hypothetical protein